jgi:hypothetical protein
VDSPAGRPGHLRQAGGVRISVDSDDLGGAGAVLRAVAADLGESTDEVDARMRRGAAALGDEAGDALRAAWAEVGRAARALVDGYASYGAALVVLAERYAELDARLLRDRR